MITAGFETTCTGPPVDSTDPSNVIRVLTAAVNERDAGAVCSLFPEDGQLMAEELTPEDDNPFGGEYSIIAIAAADGVVSWTGRVTSPFDDPATACFGAGVDGGKILWLEDVECIS